MSQGKTLKEKPETGRQPVSGWKKGKRNNASCSMRWAFSGQCGGLWRHHRNMERYRQRGADSTAAEQRHCSNRLAAIAAMDLGREGGLFPLSALGRGGFDLAGLEVVAPFNGTTADPTVGGACHGFDRAGLDPPLPLSAAVARSFPSVSGGGVA